jgi:hypothetical protein
MKTTKTIVINVKLILILSSLILLFSCKKEENVEWSIAITQPKNFVAEGQHVFYLKEGKIISSSATITNIGNAGWTFPQNGRTSGTTDFLPDSVVVDYGGLNFKNQMCTYRGGMSLPTKILDSLFKVGYFKNGKKENFKKIITGLAPGGRICVWLDHVEIKRGIVEQEDIYRKSPSIITDKKSFIIDSIEINTYLKYHPIDFTIWENSDPRYELDFGFCSEEDNVELHHSFFITKEGISYAIYKRYFERTVFGIPFDQPSSNDLFFGYIQVNEDYNYKFQLPVHCKIEWKSKTDKEVYYSTDVVFPKDFQKRFKTVYFDSLTNKNVNFNRLIFGVEKDQKHCVIWIDGPNKQEKIMRFKAQVGNMVENVGLNSGGYATEVEYY